MLLFKVGYISLLHLLNHVRKEYFLVGVWMKPIKVKVWFYLYRVIGQFGNTVEVKGVVKVFKSFCKLTEYI